MNVIRRTATVLLFAAALGLPVVASTPAHACEGSKAEHKQPTAQTNTSTSKQDNKSDAKSQDKSNQSKQADKSSTDQQNKS